MLTVLVVGWTDPRQCQALMAAMPEGVALEFASLSDDLESKVGAADVMVVGALPAKLGALARNLKLLQVDGGGLDGVEYDSLPATAIVANVYEHGVAMAEYVFMGLLAMARGLFAADAGLRAGNWSRSWVGGGQQPGSELHGRVLAVLGLGEVGAAISHLARGFGMQVIGVSAHPDRHRDIDALWIGDLASVSRALAEADAVAVALPLTQETRGLIGREELAQMKPSAVLVNVGRAAIIDEDALFDALASRQIFGAVLDVWYQYPSRGATHRPSSRPFSELPNVVMTPHIAAWTREAMDARARVIADQIRRLMDGAPLRNIVRGSKTTGDQTIGKTQ